MTCVLCLAPVTPICSSCSKKNALEHSREMAEHWIAAGAAGEWMPDEIGHPFYWAWELGRRVHDKVLESAALRCADRFDAEDIRAMKLVAT